jgi:arabinogalactan endo-1,4-beta-galactosidase
MISFRMFGFMTGRFTVESMDATQHFDRGCRRRLGALVFAGLMLGNGLNAFSNQVTYQVNLGVQRALGNFNPAGGDTVIVSGTFSAPDWSTTSTLTPTVGDTNVYTGTFNNDISPTDYVNFKFIINPGGNSPAGQLIWESGDNRFFQVAASNQTLPVVYFNNITNLPAPSTNAPLDFLAGADLSHLKFFEDRGSVYRVNGQPQDALNILKDQGINCVRLRLFTSSATQAQADPYNYINNLDYVLPLAVRVKNAGLKLLLDFHYSDSWADPGKQNKPAAWTNLNFTQLKAQIRSYSSNAIATLKAGGGMPDYVQIGNEITPGMLWHEGHVGGAYENSTQWSQLAQLMTNAIQGVRDASGTNPPGIMVHIDRGGDWATTQWFYDKLTAQNVPFDIIGLSYYPFWHGTLDSLQTCLNNAAARYQKPVVVAETGFPFSNSTNIFGIPATTNGQVQFVKALAEVVKGVPGRRGAGIFWWAAEYQQLSGYGLAGFDRRSLFGTTGNVLPAAPALGQLAAPVVLTGSVNHTNLQLRWPLSGAGMSLTSTTSVAPASVWVPITNAVENTNLTYRTSVPIEDGSVRFFRLQSN